MRAESRPVTALCLFALLTVATVPAAGRPSLAASVSQSDCELHASGAGYPNRLAEARNSLFFKSSPQPAGYNSFNAVNRANELPDNLLRQLFSPDVRVKIVRHEQMLDLDKRAIKRESARLYSSSAACYSDLVVLQTTAIWPNPNVAYQQAGAIGALIVGGNRAVVTYWLQTHRPELKKPERLQKKFDSPLASPPADIRANPARMRESMARATEDTLKQFVAFVRKKRTSD